MSCMCHAAGHVLSGGGLPCEYVCCCTSVTTDGAQWAGLGGAVVPAPRTLPLLLELEEVEQNKVGPACDV